MSDVSDRVDRAKECTVCKETRLFGIAMRYSVCGA